MPTPRLAILLLAIAWLPTCILSAQTDSSTPADQPVANQPTDENAPQTPSDPEPADSVNESSTQSTDDSAAENENTAPAEAEPETQQTETQENTPLETAEKVEESTAATIDKIFGEWVVKPFGSVLFFDFWTESWLGTSIPFVVIWLLTGAVFLTIKMGFINLRAFRHAIDLTRGKYDKPGETKRCPTSRPYQRLFRQLSALETLLALQLPSAPVVPVHVLIIAIGLLGMSAKFAGAFWANFIAPRTQMDMCSVAPCGT